MPFLATDELEMFTETSIDHEWFTIVGIEHDEEQGLWTISLDPVNGPGMGHDIEITDHDATEPVWETR